MKSAAALLLACATLLTPAARGLPSDREQPLAVEADRAVRDEKAGKTSYNGAVRLVQGSLIIEAEELIIFHRRDRAERVVATGNPARMQQQPELEEPVIHAEGLRITYFVAAERIFLEGQAEVEQDGATVRGERINYLIREQLVRADAVEGSGERVQVVIPPRLAEEGAETAAQTDDGRAGSIPLDSTESGAGALPDGDPDSE